MHRNCTFTWPVEARCFLGYVNSGIYGLRFGSFFWVCSYVLTRVRSAAGRDRAYDILWSRMHSPQHLALDRHFRYNAGPFLILQPESSNLDHQPIIVDRDFRIQGTARKVLKRGSDLL